MNKIEQLKELLSLINDSNGDDNNDISNEFIGKYCIVRTYCAGVHVGIVKNIDVKSMSVILSDSRRIWRWEGAFTLSEISKEGIGQDSKLSIKIDSILLLNCCEIIPVSEKAKKIILSIKGYANE